MPYDGGAFSNSLLRIGEVKRFIKKTDPRSLSKRYNEYDVLVEHRENGTVVNKLYHNCLMSNLFGGLADKVVFTLRADSTGNLELPGDGSKVLMLCINAEHAAPVILSGIREDTDEDLPEGHNLRFVFNGIQVEIKDDGSFNLQYLGKTNNLNERDPNLEDNTVGTKVEINPEGSISTTTNKGQIVQIDNVNDTINIIGNEDVTINANKIHLGTNAGQQAVMGNELLSIMEEFLDAVLGMTMFHFAGATGTPVNAAQFLKVKRKLSNFLSNQSFVKKNP